MVEGVGPLLGRRLDDSRVWSQSWLGAFLELLSLFALPSSLERGRILR
jgi:hypothetical protein